MYTALRLGWLGNFPTLTAKMFNSDRPNSTASAKGHLQQKRQKPRRSASRSHPSRIPLVLFDQSEADDEKEYLDCIFSRTMRTTDFLNSSDMAGRFPYVSHRGYEYIMVSVFRNYIHVELLQNRTASEVTRVYKATYTFYSSFGHTPRFQMLDNETSKELSAFFKNAEVEAEYVPPNTHRRNRAERAI